MKPSRLPVGLLAVLLLAVGASSASAVTVHLENGTTLSYLAAPGTSPPGAGSAQPFDAFFDNLDYNGGPVMTSNTNYTLYWSPAGAGAYPAGFITGVNTYFKDLEHDSGGHQNVDSVASQYNDAAGEFAEYNSKFGGELLDKHGYPFNGCTSAPKCLTDEQIQDELVRFISEEHLPTGLNHEYFVLTPEGVESCFEAAGLACSANAESHQAYCAYHGNIPLEGGGEIVYANDPFVNGKNCDEPTHHINGPSDSALFGGLSHEHNESVTDPEPNNAWTDFGGSGGTTGYEIGDKCRTFKEATEFGTPIGEVEVEGKKLTYNQEINGHRYWYQQEWSNKGHECLQRLTFEASETPNATFTSSAVAGDEVKFDATGSSTGARYTWQFNDLLGHHENTTIETSGLTLNHTFPSAGTYTVALTVFKPDGTSKGIAKKVFVGEKPQSIKFESSAPGSAAVEGASYSVSAKASSELSVELAIDASSGSVCSISGSTVSFIAAGMCTIDADQAGDSEYEPAVRVQQSFPVAKGSQSINFTSSAPSSAAVGGSTYAVTATGGGSGNTVTITIDATSTAVCSISDSTVSFIGPGTCTIDANQAGSANFNAAAQGQQSFAVGKGVQAITFTSAAPSSAAVGGSTYAVTATGGASGSPVGFTIDASSGSVCSMSGSTVSFIGSGICTIDANQAGSASFNPAPQAQQSFAVSAPSTSTSMPTSPTPMSPLIPSLVSAANSNFTATGASFSPTTGAITFTESVGEPGTFSWLLTFQNGKFGAFASSKTKCKSDFIRLNGKCLPSRIVFAKGSRPVTASGRVSFTLKPSASALKALKNAVKQRKALPVTMTLTFQSSLGGSPVSHTQSLAVRLKK